MHHDRPVILIAERDPFMHNTLTRTLEEHFDLVFVEDGAAVLEQVRVHSPALIILEVILPTLDGFQVCRQLKNEPTTRHIPVLIFTLLLAEERAVQMGADAFLLKPLQHDVFLRTIYRLLTDGPAGQEEQS